MLTGRIGRLLDRDYRLTARSHGLVVDRVRGDDLLLFPIELARLRSFFYAFGTAMVAIVGYGWLVQVKFVHVPTYSCEWCHFTNFESIQRCRWSFNSSSAARYNAVSR